MTTTNPVISEVSEFTISIIDWMVEPSLIINLFSKKSNSRKKLNSARRMNGMIFYRFEPTVILPVNKPKSQPFFEKD